MKKNQKGFTLVELIIVIAIIGVLAAILIPVFANVIEKANLKSALSDARNAIEQLTVEAADHMDMREQIVIFVKKGGSIYVYGFDRADCGGGGTGIDLMAATSLPGFDTSIWSISSGAHPVLINAAEFL